MKKIFFALFAIGCITACEKHTDANVISQICGGYDVEIKLSDTGDSINANINGDDVVLAHAISASGARFVGVLNDTPITMWNKGEMWTLFVGDDDVAVATECIAK